MSPVKSGSAHYPITEQMVPTFDWGTSYVHASPLLSFEAGIKALVGAKNSGTISESHATDLLSVLLAAYISELIGQDVGGQLNRALSSMIEKQMSRDELR